MASMDSKARYATGEDVKQDAALLVA
jgi:hypothetical protein